MALSDWLGSLSYSSLLPSTYTSDNTSGISTGTTWGGWDLTARQAQEQMVRNYQRTTDEVILRALGHPSGTKTPTGERTLTLIKKSIKQINAEAVSKEAQGRVEDKILRLLELGATAQATILEAELKVRQKLNHLKEWDYKVLPYEAIKEYEGANKNWDGNGGRILVHIDPLADYIGTVERHAETSKAADKLIPDDVLDELEVAKERKLFDTFSVLWVEKVKDPLLLGCIDGCKDFFLIAQWGDDVKFEDLVKE